MKGADVAMTGIVQYSDWLEEEVCIGHVNLYGLYGHSTVLYSDWLEEEVCIGHVNLYGLYGHSQYCIVTGWRRCVLFT